MPPIDPNANRPAKTKVRTKRRGAVGRGADTTAPPARPRPKPVAGPPAPKPKTPTRVVAVRPPDRADERAAVRARQLERSVPKTPDQADRKRSSDQKRQDQRVVARNVRDSRLKVVTREGAGSGTRAVKKLLSDSVATMTGGASRRAPTTVKRKGTGQPTGFAAIDAQRTTKRVPGVAFGVGSNALADAGELLVTTPSSLAHLAKTAATDPAKVPGMLIEPYKQLAKDPVGFAGQRPVTTALMVQPAVRLPGRAVGKAARVAGKQTLERPAATLPGSALKEKRTGSRDVVVRAVQSRKDKKNPDPKIDAAGVTRRVDEHAEFSRQHASRAEKKAARDSWRSTRGRPRAERERLQREAMDQAREKARRDSDEIFAREFGATARPSTGAADRAAAKAARDAAGTRKTAARTRVTQANTAHAEAMTAAQLARLRARTSPAITALEKQRTTAQRELARAQRDARAAAPGIPRQDAAQAVRDARATVRQLDQDIARARNSGVPAAERTLLVRAVGERRAAQAELAAARAAAKTAKREHIRVKDAMRNGTLVDNAAEGRLFAEKADANLVARKLTEQGHQVKVGGAPARFHVPDEGVPRLGPAQVPLEFTVRKVGDQWTVVPKLANDRITRHGMVGSSEATPAKILRRSRGLFTQTVLPTSLKWMTGQAAEAGIRATVAGAGPLDLLRMNRVVKQLNRQRAGAGDELLMRVTGGQTDSLTGAARDFAKGKSLAEEFKGTKLEQPAAAATRAGATAPAQAVRKGWRAYTEFVFNTLNSPLENTARKAMAGHAIKTGQLMEQRVIGLSDQAIADAARGLHGTEAQVQLGRAVDRMYGQYSKFSPERRSLIMHWTPFLPWYLNVATFLFKVLPQDHPVTTALIADTSAATEQWRKEAGLSLRYGDEAGRVPDFLLGSVPAEGGGFHRIAKYTPMGIGTDVGGAVSGLALPQFRAPVLNLLGLDWKGSRMRDGDTGEDFTKGQRAVRAGASLIESHTPVVGKVGQLTGFTQRKIDRKAQEDIPPLNVRLKRELPTTPAEDYAPAKPKTKPGGVKIKQVKVKQIRVKPIKVKPIKIGGR